jgi:hypothetical protein
LPRRTFLFIIENLKRLFRPRFLFLLVAAFSISAQAEDQSAAKKKAATSGELFEAIARMDSAIFHAFNAHDVERLMSLFAADSGEVLSKWRMTNRKEFRNQGISGALGERSFVVGR